ncbi:MAG TPA: copper-translocating P-type ATPase [Candidatus Limnocylindria bacterium]|nr:copper-translocating P-type ATPase [Candidatus Limnocylindria bacterium]
MIRRMPHVVGARVDPERMTAHVTVRRGMTDAIALRARIDACNYLNPVPLPRAEVSSHEHVHEAAARTEAHGGHEAMGHDMSDPRMAASMEADMKRRFQVALALTIPVVALSPLGTLVLGREIATPVDRNWVMLAFTTPVALWASSVFHVGAWRSLRTRVLNMSVLVSLGILVSYLFSVALTLTVGGETFYEAAAMLAVFLLFGHWMEMRARRGSSEAVRTLLELAPAEANVERDGAVTRVSVAEVSVGDVLVLRSGERVAVDGEVIDGRTSIDESMVTGESIPVAKGAGDEVVAGTMNAEGSIRYRATKVGADTALARIARLVETAQSSKAPAQRLADRAAHWLVIAAVSAGVVTLLFWLFVAREPLLFAMTLAVTTVVIACPDALGLATPTAVMVATDIGARHGILFKEAASLELASRIRSVIFDKTGTLTEGRPRVTDVVVAGGGDEAGLLRLVAGAEARSGHPLSAALLAETERRAIATPSAVGDFAALGGRGVRARVDGREIVVGTRRLMEESGYDVAPVARDVERLLSEGKTLMIAAIDGRVAGVVAVQDRPRATARAAVERLRALGVEVAMLTGDNRQTADAIARELGIERVLADVLPEHKADEVKRLQAEGKFVAMVGDGVNDAPALAQADLGIAIGAGTDVAVETGDIVLMRSDPADVLAAIRLSRATVRKMKQNLFWAAIYNLIAIPVAAGALWPSLGILLRPEFGALAMSASSITVVGNALLLRRAEADLAA